MDTYYVSKERLKELELELEEYKTTKRRKVADNLREAKELGDLSENTAYDEARLEQERIERRIGELEEMIKNAEIIKHKKSASITIGSTIKVKKGTKKIEYKITGSNEADPANGKISNESPLGGAFLGKKKGDKVTVATPAGPMHYEVISFD